MDVKNDRLFFFTHSCARSGIGLEKLLFLLIGLEKFLFL